jgi:3-hydroxymyristoyl/3-hydroxydecanoyl-(acyl carrier protein) dehydratase
MSDTPPFELADILSILPHRPPFLFVDRVTHLDPGKSIVAERVLRADEPQFAGHFPGRPIMPGALVAEALAQASGLLIGFSRKMAPTPYNGPKSFLLAATNVKFTHPASPGNLLILRAAAERDFGGLFLFKVEAAVGENIVATGSLTLTSVEDWRA